MPKCRASDKEIVPKSIVKQRFAKEIKRRSNSTNPPARLGHAIEDHKLKVIGSPEVNPDDIKVKEGEALKFTAARNRHS